MIDNKLRKKAQQEANVQMRIAKRRTTVNLTYSRKLDTMAARLATFAGCERVRFAEAEIKRVQERYQDLLGKRDVELEDLRSQLTNLREMNERQRATIEALSSQPTREERRSPAREEAALLALEAIRSVIATLLNSTVLEAQEPVGLTWKKLRAVNDRLSQELDKRTL